MEKIIFALLSLSFLAGIDGGNSLGRWDTKDHHSVSREVAEFGINRGAQVYEVICWFEYLKVYLPSTRGENFNQCHGQAAFQSKMLLSHRAPERFFGRALLNYAMYYIPKEYMTCAKYLLDDRLKKPETNFSQVLNDNFTQPYPYQAFAHCMISVVYQNHKEKGLRQISEKLKKQHDFGVAMLERENELRAIHGTEPLKLNSELTNRAQKWAEQLAKDCQMYHIHSSHPDYRFNGTRMGENLFTGDHVNSPPDEVSLLGVSIWYEEIKYYPWPEYKGYGHDSLFPKFAHFSQMLWRDSKEVGYGYAVNRDKSCSRYFVVSRYYPPGNIYDTFADNVLPPNH